MKKLLVFLIAIILTMSLAACELPWLQPTTPTDSTATTEPLIDLTAAARAKLEQYADLFEWGGDVVEIIMTSVPDIHTLDHVEGTDDEFHYIIFMKDTETGAEIEYCLDLGENREALRIYFNTGDDSVTERHFLFNIG